MGKITVFLAEDHAVVREGLAELIRHEVDMDVVGEAGDGEDTVRQVKQLKPDIVLMDIAMPGVNGVAFVVCSRREMEITLFGGRFVLAFRANTFVSLGVSVTICSCCHSTCGRRITRDSASEGEEAVMVTHTEMLAGWLVVFSAVSSNSG